MKSQTRQGFPYRNCVEECWEYLKKKLGGLTTERKQANCPTKDYYVPKCADNVENYVKKID